LKQRKKEKIEIKAGPHLEGWSKRNRKAKLLEVWGSAYYSKGGGRGMVERK